MKNLKKIPFLILLTCLSYIPNVVESAVQSAQGLIHFEDLDFANEADYNDYVIDYQVSAHYQAATGIIYSFWILINPMAAGATHDLELKVNKEFTDAGGFCELMVKDGTQDLPTNQVIYENLSKAFLNCPESEYINTVNGRGTCKGQPAVIQCTNLASNPLFKLLPDPNGDTLENLASRFIVLKNNTLNVEYKHDSQVNSMGSRWITPPDTGITTEKTHFFNLILKKDFEANIDGVNRSIVNCDPRTNNFASNPHCNQLIKSYFTNHHSRSLMLSEGDAKLVNKRVLSPEPWQIKKNTGIGTYSETEGYDLMDTQDFIDMVLEGSYARAGRSGLCKFIDCLSFEPPGGTIIDQEGYACAGGCSDPSKTSESSCLAVGVCSDTAHTTKAACEAPGRCIGPSGMIVALVNSQAACDAQGLGHTWQQSNTWTITNSWDGERYCSSTDLYCAFDKTCKSTTGANGQHCDDASDCSSPSMSCLTDMRSYAPIETPQYTCASCDGPKVCTDNNQGSPCTSSEDNIWQEYDSSVDSCNSGLQCLTRLHSSEINGLEYTCTAIDSKLCTNNAHCPADYLCNCNDSTAASDCTTEHTPGVASLSVGRCYRNIWSYTSSSSIPVVEGDYCEFFVDSKNIPSTTSGRWVSDYYDGHIHNADPVNSSELVYGCIDTDGHNDFGNFPNFNDCPHNVQGAAYLPSNGYMGSIDTTHSTYTPYVFHWLVQASCTDGSSCVQRDSTDNFKMCTFL